VPAPTKIVLLAPRNDLCSSGVCSLLQEQTLGQPFELKRNNISGNWTRGTKYMRTKVSRIKQRRPSPTLETFFSYLSSAPCVHYKEEHPLT